MNNSKGFITRIKEYFKVKRNIKKLYCEFFNVQYKNEKSYKLMDDIPDEISKVYELIKDKKKFTKKSELYLPYNERKQTHNEKITFINTNISDFDFDEYLTNLENINIDDVIEKYQKSYNLVSEIKVKNDIFKNFEVKYKDLTENFEIIKTQYNLLIYLEKNQEIKDYDYIDGNIRQNLLNTNDLIKNKLSSYKKKYYSFRFKDLNLLVDIHNDEFVKNNLNDPIFDDVNGKSLDIDQRTTILKNDVANLTVAGAGSGKTLTICGKAKYLIEKFDVKPNEILLLSYSHKSAEDLNKKIKTINEDLKASTFHSLGLNILNRVNQKKLTIEEQFKAIVEKYFSEEIFKDNNKLLEIINYIGLYMNDATELPKFKDEGELFEDLKNQDLTTIKDQVIKYSQKNTKLVTFKQELVKSKQELAIANYYFINGIKYVYEKPYEYDTSTIEKRQYTPDFYLPDYKIYHEHYGINKNNEAVQYGVEGSIKYVQGMEWKRKTHKEHNTKCLETYSYEFSDNTIFYNLQKQLEENHVEFHPLSGKDIKDVMESIYNDISFNSIKNIMVSFVSLYKSNYKDESGFEILKQTKFSNLYSKNRTCLFLDICKNLYKYYINYLKHEEKIDFDDMILKSLEVLPTINGYKYKYIIVDEFQDISQTRMRFLKALIEHGNSKLFAVGDDWQAIYRFNGCDVNIFIDFKNYFKFPTINYIHATHRNSQEITNIASRFIMKNPYQLKKEIRSEKHLINPLRIAFFNENKYSSLLLVLKEINLLNPKANVMLIGRNNNDIKELINDNFIFKGGRSFLCKEYPMLNINFTTAHGSKGLEEDYVIIINTYDRKYGFPNKMEDDPVLDLVLSKPDNFNYAEERRLFYVALTRTRSYTFLLVNIHSMSPFVKEIMNDAFIMNPNCIEEDNGLTCPKCHSGKLVIRQNGEGEQFYSCSNFPYCHYTNDFVNIIDKNKKCPICGDYVVLKNGKYGLFYKCCNKNCTYRLSYKKIK